MIAKIEYTFKGETIVDERDFSAMVNPPDVGGIAKRFHDRMQLKKTYLVGGKGSRVHYVERYKPEDYHLIKIEIIYPGPCGGESGKITHAEFKDMETPKVAKPTRAVEQEQFKMEGIEE